MVGPHRRRDVLDEALADEEAPSSAPRGGVPRKISAVSTVSRNENGTKDEELGFPIVLSFQALLYEQMK